MRTVAKVYAALILKGLKTIEDVPKTLQDAVLAALGDKGEA